MTDLPAARSSIMAYLANCPVCGADVQLSEKSDNLELIEFTCEAAFYLQPGSMISVSRVCATPTHVAVRQLELDAVTNAAKEAS